LEGTVTGTWRINHFKRRSRSSAATARLRR
jgi:hypothetical protein